MSRDIDNIALRGVWSWNSCTGIHRMGKSQKLLRIRPKIGQGTRYSSVITTLLPFLLMLYILEEL